MRIERIQIRVTHVGQITVDISYCRPMVAPPVLDNTDELAQLQLKFLRDQNVMQSLPPIPKLDELTSISEEGRDILLKQVQYKMVTNQLK